MMCQHAVLVAIVHVYHSFEVDNINCECWPLRMLLSLRSALYLQVHFVRLLRRNFRSCWYVKVTFFFSLNSLGKPWFFFSFNSLLFWKPRHCTVHCTRAPETWGWGACLRSGERGRVFFKRLCLHVAFTPRWNPSVRRTRRVDFFWFLQTAWNRSIRFAKDRIANRRPENEETVKCLQIK